MYMVTEISKMEKPQIQIDDLVRDMTDEEIEIFVSEQEKAQAEKLAAQAKTEARESALSKLAALGLTEAEIAAL